MVSLLAKLTLCDLQVISNSKDFRAEVKRELNRRINGTPINLGKRPKLEMEDWSQTEPEKLTEGKFKLKKLNDSFEACTEWEFDSVLKIVQSRSDILMDPQHHFHKLVDEVNAQNVEDRMMARANITREEKIARDKTINDIIEVVSKVARVKKPMDMLERHHITKATTKAACNGDLSTINDLD